MIRADTVHDVYTVIDGPIEVGAGPWGAAVSSDGTHVYVGNCSTPPAAKCR